MTDTPRFINIADIPFEDGSTPRERNNAMQHEVPLLSMVEINCGITEGMRLFVIGHSRDCDGTPLYVLSHDWVLAGHWHKVREIESFMRYYKQGACSGSYSKDSFDVIFTRDEIIERIKEEGWIDASGTITHPQWER